MKIVCRCNGEHNTAGIGYTWITCPECNGWYFFRCRCTKGQVRVLHTACHGTGLLEVENDYVDGNRPVEYNGMTVWHCSSCDQDIYEPSDHHSWCQNGPKS